MNLQIPRPTLLSAIQAVAAASSTKAGPFGNCVLLGADGNQLFLTVDSIQLRAEIQVDCEVKESGECLLPIGRLDILHRDDYTTVGLRENNGVLAFSTEKPHISANIPLLCVNSAFPDRSGGKQVAFTILDPVEFGHALNVASKLAGDGSTHSWNSSVQIVDDGKALRVVSGDGKAFCIFTLPTTGVEFETLIPAAPARSIVSELENAESLTMAVFPKRVEFAADELSLTVQTAVGDYGPVIKLGSDFDASNEFKLTVGRDELLRALASAASFLDSPDDSIILAGKGGTLIASAISTGSSSFSESIATKIDHELIPRGFNHHKLSSLARVLRGDNVTIGYGDKLPAVRITSDNPSERFYLSGKVVR